MSRPWIDFKSYGTKSAGVERFKSYGKQANVLKNGGKR
nr:MAG TPA: hypothetical protein [Caudoviricetes sp.]